MKKLFLLRSLVGASVVFWTFAGPSRSVAQVISIKSLTQGFAHPPDESKPMVRWWWFGVAVEKPELLHELQQMKADGIGGAELAFVYPEALDDASKKLTNLPFLSPDMLDAVKYAQAEGQRLGLRIDVTLCSGWPYGGPATTLDLAAARLRVVENLVPGGGVLPVPKLAEGETLVSAALVSGQPKHWDAGTAQTLKLPSGSSSLTVQSGAGDQTILFFVASHTRQQVKRAAVGAEGYVLDPFSRQAVAAHLQAVGEPLVKAFGSTPPYAIFSDSLEAYGADWTPNLLPEFRRRRGYDLTPHLPELVAGGSAAAQTVRHDYGRTLTELVDENYLTQINDWAKAHKTRFRSQTYGEPAVSFSSQRLVGLAEGEGPQWRAFSTLRWASSANHVFGHPVTSGETFTWLHSPVFRATPLDMKAEADIDFIMGENQLIFHGWPYSPPADKAEEPGWSLYAAAVFNDHNPWHPVMPAVTGYIARISWLLRQGKAANQVAILLPTDDAWASFAPTHVTVTGAMQKLISPALMAAILSGGYNVDYIDADAVGTVGINYPLLVLPPTDRLPAGTLKKIAAYAAGGGMVIALGHLPTLDPEGKSIPNFAEQSKGIVVVQETEQLGRAMHDLLPPDLQLDNGAGSASGKIGFIRRSLPNADVYFVANTGNAPIHVEVKLASSYRGGMSFDPDTGRQSEAVQANRVLLDLAPYGSTVYVFSAGASGETRAARSALSPLADLSGDWKVEFPALQKTVDEAVLTDWLADPATMHYSGEAIYTREISLKAVPATGVYLEVDGGSALPGSPNSAPEHALLGADRLPNPLVTRTGPGMHAYFDPPVREAALVTINGQAAGALWHPPYRLDVGKLLKPGVNRLEIRVFNTALNAWSALPPRDYKPLLAKYGDRFQMQDLDRVKPVSSGIMGTIRLVQ